MVLPEGIELSTSPLPRLCSFYAFLEKQRKTASEKTFTGMNDERTVLEHSLSGGQESGKLKIDDRGDAT